jgi:hypothetical protein
MNVLILTPDRTGSSLLLNLITIYMQFHEYDHPVLSYYDLGYGLVKYYSDVFNNEVLDSAKQFYDCDQTLPEIRDLLKSVDHYKTSRLSFATIQRRQDSVADQNKFYQYLNENFFIISARRENLFEHALSSCIKIHTKLGNVSDPHQKFNLFADVYKNKILISKENIHKHLDQYQQYLKWCNDHFDIGSYFYYDKNISNVEQYILQLPIFDNQRQKISWKNKFDIEFNEWNKVNNLISDLSGLGQQLQLTNSDTPLLTDHGENIPKWQLSVTENHKKIVSSLNQTDVEFLKKHARKFVQANNRLDELLDYKIIERPMQVKLQTMIEKKLSIKNFDQCVEWYNEWVTANNLGQIYSEDTAYQSEINELKSWHTADILEHHQQ